MTVLELGADAERYRRVVSIASLLISHTGLIILMKETSCNLDIWRARGGGRAHVSWIPAWLTLPGGGPLARDCRRPHRVAILSDT